MFLKLYGAISKIYEPCVFKKCTPVFVRELRKGKHTKFYRLDDDGKVIEIDLKKYGSPVFLPASKKKVNDGNEYFIVYRSTQNATLGMYATYLRDVCIATDDEAFWMSADLSMGIKFPDKFVCVLSPGIDEDRLEKMMWTT